MGKDILHRVGNGGHCGCETVSREVLPQVEIPEKWTQEPPCFAITIGVRLRSHTNKDAEMVENLTLFVLYMMSKLFQIDAVCTRKCSLFPLPGGIYWVINAPFWSRPALGLGVDK